MMTDLLASGGLVRLRRIYPISTPHLALGFLNPGLKRSFRSSQSLFVGPPALEPFTSVRPRFCFLSWPSQVCRSTGCSASNVVEQTMRYGFIHVLEFLEILLCECARVISLP
jgi:hypothetical protein